MNITNNAEVCMKLSAKQKQKAKWDWYRLNELCRFIFTWSVIALVLGSIINGGW